MQVVTDAAQPCLHILVPSSVAENFWQLTLHELQATSEVLAVLLAAICIASPTIEARLKELEPGRGRQAAAQQIEGASRVFSITDDLSPDQKQVCLAVEPCETLLQEINTSGESYTASQPCVSFSAGAGLGFLCSSTQHKHMQCPGNGWRSSRVGTRCCCSSSWAN